jgi:hypothetical protein
VAAIVGLIDPHFIVDIVVTGGCAAAAGATGKCFVAGTEVLGAGGEWQIEAVERGDRVLAMRSEPGGWEDINVRESQGSPLKPMVVKEVPDASE